MKRMILCTALTLGLFSITQQLSFAQTQTADELKAEREVLKAEMNSKEAQDRKAKEEKLNNPPPISQIQSVDGLAQNTSGLLLEQKEFNVLVPDMYKRTIGESVDGITDVTVKKPTISELTALALNINNQIVAVSKASEAVGAASNDAKSASPLQAPKATKSLNYSKDVLGLLTPELQLQLKVVNHLIATLNSAKNY